MLKALVIKELRESAGIVALAALGVLYALSELAGLRLLPWQSRSVQTYPFLYDELGFYLWLCVGGLAVALALKQTAWEIGQGTYFFLLHRPVSRRRVVVTKLAIGLVWVLAIGALLILFYAWWAATPGNMAAPFDWSMTVSAWQKWLALPLVYFGAFLAGIRPGRWFGSRLLPLVALAFIAAITTIMPWLWLTLLIALAAAALAVVSIFYYARERDY